MKNILKHKNKIIIFALISAVLFFVYWWGGNSPSLRGWNPNKEQESDVVCTEAPFVVQSEIIKHEIKQPEDKENKKNTSSEKSSVLSEASESNYFEQTDDPKEKAEENNISENESVIIQEKNIDATDNKLTCTLSVRCDTILENINWLKKEKVDIVPSDGVIFAEKKVVFYEGESVFNVLLREMKKNKIHFEYVNTPIYKSAYVEGIANLYEFDCGELSGWVYKVNDDFPSYGCSRYMLKQGDKIEWLYTCDLGKDVGSSSGVQKDE